MDEISLLVNGNKYEGWEEATFTRSLKAVCATFALSFTDKWLEQDEPWPIMPGDACEFFVDGELLLSGFVDDFECAMAPDSRRLSVSGRDKTCDLVDCSAKAKSYQGVNLGRFAEILCEPFGLQVRRETDTGAAFSVLKVGPGESAYDAVEKAAKQRGILVVSNADGELVLTRAGTTRAKQDLQLGVNLLTAQVKHSHKERFSIYTVQSQMGGVEDSDPSFSTSISGTAADEGVDRFRPMVIVAESQADASGARRRAIWEATTRIGKSSTVTVTVQGFHQADGVLWQINQLVGLRAQSIGVDEGELLITGVSMRKSAQGSITTLELELPEAYAFLEKAPKRDLWKALVQKESRK